MNIVEVKNVTKRFSNHTALNDLSISIPQGKVFGLLGPNGAGKTTLIRLLTRMYLPDSGTLLFNGHELCTDDVENIGYLPEERGLYKKMKISEQCVYLAQLRGLTKQEATRRLKSWFEKFGIESWWNRKVEELSKGMQQKIQFVITVVHNPDFLIFDEPFSGFDPVNAEMLKKEILELKQKGATIILSTHNMASVEEICDEIALVNHGQNVLSGELNDVRRRFRQNRFRICYETNSGESSPLLPDGCQLIDSHSDNSQWQLSVQLSEGLTPNSFLDFYIRKVNVLSFNEILPSMNDIFIQTVQSQNSNGNE